ncbi:outer membrane protein assembly factor BamB family protein [Actinoplanes aureus]|uniref:PQQ-binding-like beta-propeller repeat protein n=1 Tax=Actinoplanes aureus TaxID=2792083 RepID=A0A931G0Z9_9ACTN|nr:PQQ-binding-like beta-propeller repeat protein [Actinoplanes aureus]MBG0561884.1 PQQ-binding-like beta-propeller repeat protein [Actinoplanes aureus]
MSVIELGDVSSAAPGPERRETGPEFDPRSWRRVAAAGVVILCLLVFAASGRPGAPMVRQVWQIRPPTDYAMTAREDGLFVSQRSDHGTELVAYDLATGAARWRLPTEGEPGHIIGGEEAGMLLIPGDEKLEDIRLDDDTLGVVAYGGSTTAVDSRAGYRLWRQTGEVLHEQSDTLLLGERNRNSDITSIRLIEARTGTTIWQRAVTGVRHVVVPLSAPGRIVTADDLGNLTARRYDDGTVLAERRVPWIPSRPDSGLDMFLAEANGLLLATRNTREKSEITAYRLDALDQLWRIETSAYAWTQGCGPVLCVSESKALTALEPLTGRPVWRLPDYSGVIPVAEDRLLAATPGQEPEHQILVDPATGRQIGPGGAGWPLYGSVDDDSLLLLHRIIGTGTAYSGVSELDLKTGRIYRIGAIDGFDGPQCGSAGRFMACDHAGRVVVTAFG